ncbi:hypothetical protein SK128_028373 [Halocaridina rubra]|uniref:Uncharacterized protein n=1 Tax=Halocaridina rubra TaxID=373956 RepID=A0AAN8XDA7_HALRR
MSILKSIFLYSASEYCNFTNRKKSIQDQFVAGLLNEDIVEKIELLYSKDGVLTLDDPIFWYAWMYNDVHEGRKQEREQIKRVDEVKFLRSKKETTRNLEKKCKFCGHSHLPRKCPAFGKTCKNAIGEIILQ